MRYSISSSGPVRLFFLALLLLAGFTSLAQAPTITSLSRTGGVVGSMFTINGTNFTQDVQVKLNGTVCTERAAYTTSINVRVPAGATTGPVVVSNPQGMATSTTSFTVRTGTLPTVTSFTPVKGSPGTPVTINGTGFPVYRPGTTPPADVFVSFDGVKATDVGWMSSTMVNALVPVTATTGKIMVSTLSGFAVSTTEFGVKPAGVPTITRFSPASGPVGTVITVEGTNLYGITQALIGNTVCPVSSVMQGQFTTKIPAGATTGGPIKVTTSGGTATSASSFTITR